MVRSRTGLPCTGLMPDGVVDEALSIYYVKFRLHSLCPSWLVCIFVGRCYTIDKITTGNTVH